ncbi:G-protein coupled receptor [Elysia marginata]|uniref:G-protein coupled receptor n=1 Tax=Elysia marginata TaxID=1093978 RepID=A0AAV4I8J5_9GAST|nr:G-protein coupled receptor [Elysia marginata]
MSGSSNSLSDARLMDVTETLLSTAADVINATFQGKEGGIAYSEDGDPDVFLDVTASPGVAGRNFTNATEASFERYVRIIVPTIFGFILVLGLFGNSLVIIVVLADKHMRNTTNILILSLAFADLFFILFCVPFTATGYAMTVWPFGDVGCKMAQYAMHVCAYASVYTLVLMALDRYVAVVHAIRSMTWRSERNTWIAVFIIWVLCLTGNSPILVQYNVHEYPFNLENRSVCINTHHLRDKMVGQIFFSILLSIGYIVPLGVTLLMYGLMLKRLLYGVVPGGANQSTESIRAKKRVTRMVVIVEVIFAICWMPIQIILVLVAFEKYPRTEARVVVMFAANCLAYMNSCVNPILYAFLSENFRRSFRRFLCCNTGSRRMEYERTNARFTVTENNATKMTCVNNSKMYTPV